ncbi:10207_t:CDS:2 [Cetraspora pellucida]|uniref:10207_t:CDS:1 n=1 Tax=Cetraspora pellucida TaxID=1433469 RepID=A0A9N9NCX2_9GLOM|nr:10207_t:CDS:2 [Cetraspora pellucida]
MTDPGNANTLKRGELYGFQLPTPNINAFEESSEPASFAGGPIRHRKKRNHTNTPYTRIASSSNPNPQETHWLLNIVKKYIPQWLRSFIWPATMPITEDTPMEITSTEIETITGNIVQSSIEELNNAIVKREEQPQPSQLDTITKMNLKSKFNRSSSKIAARFGRRMYSNPLHRRGTIPRKRVNHVSAREEDLLYPDEINESLSDKEQLPEIPADWYKPFKNLAVNDSFSTSSSGTSTPSQEPEASKKSLSQGPPLKKFKSDLVPDINWFNYHPSEKRVSIPSSSTSKNQNISTDDNLPKVPFSNSLSTFSKPDDSELYLKNDEEISTTPLIPPKFTQIVKNEQYYNETKKKIDFTANGSVSNISVSTPPISKGILSVSTPVNKSKRSYDTVFTTTPTIKPSFGPESRVVAINEIQESSDLFSNTTTPKSIFEFENRTQSTNLAINTPFKSVTGFNGETLNFSLPQKPLIDAFSVPPINKNQEEQPPTELIVDSTEVEDQGSVNQNIVKPQDKPEETPDVTELTVVNIEPEKRDNKEEEKSKDDKENKDKKDNERAESQGGNEYKGEENKEVQEIEENKESEGTKDEQENKEKEVKEDKNKVFEFYSPVSRMPTLASSPPSGSPMDIDMGNSNLNHQSNGVSNPTFPTAQFNFGLGNVFFNDNSSTEVSSSNKPNYSRSSSFRGKNRRHGSHLVVGNEGRNMSIPKTGSFEGSDFSRMMLPEGSSFSFELQKETTTIPSIQPVSTSTTFKFNQETPNASTEPLFQTNGATFNFQSSFPSQPFSAPVTFNFGGGLNPHLPATQPVFNMNGDSQVFQNGTNTNVQKNIQSNNADRPIAKLRRRRIK